jgi:hypothetical protein
MVLWTTFDNFAFNMRILNYFVGYGRDLVILFFILNRLFYVLISSFSMLGFFFFCMSYFILKILIENLFGVENSTINSEGFFSLSFITFVSFAIIICKLRINFFSFHFLF